MFARVAEVSEQIRGVSYNKLDAKLEPESGLLPILRGGNITAFGLIFEDLVYVPSNKISSKQKIKEGDVVIVASSGSLEVVGKAAVAQSDYELGFGAFCKVLRPNLLKVDASYFGHYFQTYEYRRKISSLAAGANINNLKNEHLDELLIPLPPLPEQRRIAAILDQADVLRAKRRESLALLEGLRQSIFLDMFGDPLANPRSWPEIKLGDLIINKPNNGIFKKNDQYGDGIPVVWVEELFRGQLIELNQSRKLLPTERDIEQYGLKHGDILFCRSSLKLAGIGYNNIYLGEDDKALFECHVIRISPNKQKVLPEFLNFALRMPSQRQKLFKYAKTVTMSTIDQDGLQQISVPVPPLDSQVFFCDRLKAVELISNLHRTAQSEQQELFESLQSRAFRGEL